MHVHTAASIQRRLNEIRRFDKVWVYLLAGYVPNWYQLVFVALRKQGWHASRHREDMSDAKATQLGLVGSTSQIAEEHIFLNLGGCPLPEVLRRE